MNYALTDSEVNCEDYHNSLNITDVCAFINATESCQIDEGFINYLAFIYCNFSPSTLWLGLIFVIIWWIVLFMALGKTADAFFCPNLTVLAKMLRCSDSLAGVTFVAFGNGAPDIFSALSAVTAGQNGQLGLAFGALLGAGIFVTTVVVGAICVVRPFKMVERPFLKDIIFYLAAVFWTFVIIKRGRIYLLEAIGFLTLYGFYVVVTLIGRAVYTTTKVEPTATIGNINIGDEERVFTDDENSPLISSSSAIQNYSTSTEHDMVDPVGLLPKPSERNATDTEWKRFCNSVNPIDGQTWSESNIFSKVNQIIHAPISLLLTFLIPLVDTSKPHEAWCKSLVVIQCVVAPMYCIFVVQAGGYSGGLHLVAPRFPLWSLVLAFSILFALVVCLTSETRTAPGYHRGFAVLGFITSVVFIYTVANEIVNILSALGVFLNINAAVLGLTLMALGNSVGDLFADYALAKEGRPRMAISACFGGPLFNMLLGVGIPFTIQTAKNGGVFKIDESTINLVLLGFLGGSLIFSLIFVPLNRFQMTRTYGCLLFALYAVFLVTSFVVVVKGL